MTKTKISEHNAICHLLLAAVHGKAWFTTCIT